MLAYQRVTNCPYPHINADLLLVSRIDRITRILLCPLVLVVNIVMILSLSKLT